MRELDLDSDRPVLARLIADGVTRFLSATPRPLALPVTRVDVEFDLTTMECPCAWAYLDTERHGVPASGTSVRWQLMERWCEPWAAACQAACDDQPVTVRVAGRTFPVVGEDELKKAAGACFVAMLTGLRDGGAFDVLPRAAGCYLGVTSVGGGFAWPAWADRGPENMV